MILFHVHTMDIYVTLIELNSISKCTSNTQNHNLMQSSLCIVAGKLAIMRQEMFFSISTKKVLMQAKCIFGKSPNSRFEKYKNLPF